MQIWKHEPIAKVWNGPSWCHLAKTCCGKSSSSSETPLSMEALWWTPQSSPCSRTLCIPTVYPTILWAVAAISMTISHQYCNIVLCFVYFFFYKTTCSSHIVKHESYILDDYQTATTFLQTTLHPTSTSTVDPLQQHQALHLLAGSVFILLFRIIIHFLENCYYKSNQVEGGLLGCFPCQNGVGPILDKEGGVVEWTNVPHDLMTMEVQIFTTGFVFFS